MNLSFNFKNIGAKAGQNVTFALWAVLIVLIVLEGFVVNQSINLLLSANHIEPTPATKLVRINFGLYDTITKRLNQQGSFQPTPVTAKNPFGTLQIPKKPN